MPRLKLKLVRVENVVVMQVLEQDSRDFHFAAKSGIDLMAVNAPELAKAVIYVRGKNESADKFCSARVFDYAFEATAYMARIIAAVEEYCAFDNPDTQATDDEPEVVIVGR